MITRIRVGEEVVKGNRNITNKIKGHFLDHFRQETLPFISFPMESFKRVNPALACELEVIHSEEEIMMAIKSCDPSKAPEYDGFNLKFLLKMWDVMGNNVVKFVKEFFVTRKFPKHYKCHLGDINPQSGISYFN